MSHKPNCQNSPVPSNDKSEHSDDDQTPAEPTVARAMRMGIPVGEVQPIPRESQAPPAQRVSPTMGKATDTTSGSVCGDTQQSSTASSSPRQAESDASSTHDDASHSSYASREDTLEFLPVRHEIHPALISRDYAPTREELLSSPVIISDTSDEGDPPSYDEDEDEESDGFQDFDSEPDEEPQNDGAKSKASVNGSRNSSGTPPKPTKD